MACWKILTSAALWESHAVPADSAGKCGLHKQKVGFLRILGNVGFHKLKLGKEYQHQWRTMV
jgi:hypothetical protein